MSSRFYFDYNATSPLSSKVVDFLRSGEFLFLHSNPASLHQSGKKSKKYINETSHYLFETFKLPVSDFDLFYHSGASEGINTIFKGLALQGFKEQQRYCFFFSTVDHACVYNLKETLEVFGHEVIYFEVDSQGNFDQKLLIEKMLQKKAEGFLLALNFTYINNETGIVWPLSRAEELKTQTGAFIHVDAVQLVGKIENWNQLNPKLDAYTFSGHKFGSLKGQGFSFLRKSVTIAPLIIGGSQQSGFRAGTENAAAVYSLKLALEDLQNQFRPQELKAAKDHIENGIAELIKGKGEVVGVQNAHRNLTTIFIMLKGLKAEMVSARFDLMGMDVSTGSACSSGVIKENRILMSMGYDKEDSKSGIRFSFSPLMNQTEAETYLKKIESALTQLLK